MDRALRGVVRSASGIGGSLVLAVLANKWIALIGGAAGIGAFGQLKSLYQTLLGIGTLNGQAAFIQGMSSRRHRERWAFASVAVRAMMVTAALLCIAGLIGASWLAERLLGSSEGAAVLAVVLTIIGSGLYVMSTAATFVLIALGRLGSAARIQVAGSFGILAGVVVAGHGGWSPTAAGVAILLGGVVSSVVAWRTVGRHQLLRLVAASTSREAEPPAAQNLRAFGRMAAGLALGGAVGAAARLALRALIVRHDGLEAAGHFEAAWTVSMTYMGLLLSSLGGYLLPALSAQRDAPGRSAVLSEFLRIAVCIGVPLISAVMLFRGEAVRILYAGGFAPAAALLGVMVAGDFFKLLGWIFAMPMLAAADARAFLIYEVAFNACFLGATMLLAARGWPVLFAVGAAFVGCYVLYAMATLLYCRWRDGLSLTRQAVVAALTGAVVTGGVFVVGREVESSALRVVLLAVPLAASVAMIGDDGRKAIGRLVRREG